MATSAGAAGGGGKRLREEAPSEEPDLDDVDDDAAEAAVGDADTDARDYAYDDFNDDPAEQALLLAAYALDADELAMVPPTAAPKKARRVRKACSKEELAARRWEQLGAKTYLVRTPAARDTFFTEGKVTCSWCNAPMTVVLSTGKSSTGVLAKHERNDDHHASALAEATSGAREVLESQAHIGETKAHRDERLVVEGDLRALTTAVAVASGVVPHALDRVFGGDLMKGVMLLAQQSPPVALGSSHSRTEDDLKRGHVLLLDALKALLKSKPDMKATLEADGATRLHGRRNHLLAIKLSSTELKKPILLACAMPKSVDADGNPVAYDHVACHKDIMEVLDYVGFDIKNVVSFMGDNISFNDALARRLGVARGKCGPHAMQLMSKCASLVPGHDEIVLGPGRLIFMGGGSKRATALEARHLDPSKMISYTNRFASTCNVRQYLLGNYVTVRDFFTTSPLLSLGDHAPAPPSPAASAGAEGGGGGGGSALEELAAARTAEDVDIDDADALDLTSGPVGGTLDTTLSGKVAAAYKKNSGDNAAVVLAVGDLLFGKLPDLISKGSAESANLDLALLESMKLLRATLADHSTDSKSTVEQACAIVQENFGVSWTPSKVGMFCNHLKDGVAAAATKAVLLFDKHIAPSLDSLRRRELYSFTSKPPTLEALAAAGKLNNAFFGCSAAQFGADFRAEYRAFVEGYDSWDKTIRPSAFFRSKEDIWPRLSRVARFWLEFEFSSISVERDFGIMRAFDDANRQGMSAATFQREMFFRCNKWLLDEAFAAQLVRVEELAAASAARRGGGASSSSSAAAAAGGAGAAATSE